MEYIMGTTTRNVDADKAVARTILRTFADTENCPTNVQNAIEHLIGLNGRGRTEGSGLYFQVREMIQDSDGPVAEFTLFTEFHIGRDSMKALIAKWIRNEENPDNRVWVAFNKGAGTYSIVQQGGDTPNNWKGPSLVPRVRKTNGNGS